MFIHMQCLDSNSQLMENESPPITTRPGLPPKLTFLILTSLGFTHCLAPFGHKEQRTLQRRSSYRFGLQEPRIWKQICSLFLDNFWLIIIASKEYLFDGVINYCFKK